MAIANDSDRRDSSEPRFIRTRGSRPRRLLALALTLLLGASALVAPPATSPASAGHAADSGCDYKKLWMHNSSSSAQPKIGGGIKVTCDSSKDQIYARSYLQVKVGGVWRTVTSGAGSERQYNKSTVQASFHSCPSGNGDRDARIYWYVQVRENGSYSSKGGYFSYNDIVVYDGQICTLKNRPVA